MITTLIIWGSISFIACCINCMLAWRIIRVHYWQRAMRYLLVQKCGHVVFNAIVVFLAVRASDNTPIDAPASLDTVLITLGYAIQVVTSIVFGLYVLGMLNGGQPKIKDTDHAS